MTQSTQFPFVVRPANHADAYRLAALSIQVWLSTYSTSGISDAAARHVLSEFSANRFGDLVDNEEVLLVVACNGENLIGYALTRYSSRCPIASGPDTELSTLYVQESFTRTGVGTALLERTRAFIRDRTGSTDLWLSVKSDNTRALQFYSKHDFHMRGAIQFVLGKDVFENHVFTTQPVQA